jgi:hypothetical protein
MPFFRKVILHNLKKKMNQSRVLSTLIGFFLSSIPFFLISQQAGIYVNTSGQVGIQKDTAWQPFQVFVDGAYPAERQDQSVDLGNGNAIVIKSTESGGQLFTCGLDGIITRLSLRAKTFNSGSTGVVEIRLISGGAPTGSVISSDILEITNNVFMWYDIPLGEDIMVTAGQILFLEVTFISGDSLVLDLALNTNPYVPGNAWRKMESWMELPESDIAFKTFVTVQEYDVLTVTDEAKVKINNYTLPKTDGTINQLMSTDGAGTMVWKNIVDILPNDPPVVYSIIIPSVGFRPTYSDHTYLADLDNDGGAQITSLSTIPVGAYLAAPLTLPEGSTIHSMIAYLKDNDTNLDLTIDIAYLHMLTNGMTGTAYLVQSTGSDPDWQPLEYVDDFPIDGDKAYFVRVFVDTVGYPMSPYLSIQGVKIIYTLP